MIIWKKVSGGILYLQIQGTLPPIKSTENQMWMLLSALVSLGPSPLPLRHISWKAANPTGWILDFSQPCTLIPANLPTVSAKTSIYLRKQRHCILWFLLVTRNITIIPACIGRFFLLLLLLHWFFFFSGDGVTIPSNPSICKAWPGRSIRKTNTQPRKLWYVSVSLKGSGLPTSML